MDVVFLNTHSLLHRGHRLSDAVPVALESTQVRVEKWSQGQLLVLQFQYINVVLDGLISTDVPM